LRVVFMGTPVFAVPCLRRLLQMGEQVVGVITQPDRPQGRHMQLVASPVKAVALEHGLQVWQPDNLKGDAATSILSSAKPDLIVTAAYGKILPPPVLALPSMGCINIHASLLPLYRGAAPIHRAVMAGDRLTGITSMYMDEGLDTGDIILQAASTIGPEETAGDVHDALAELGAEVLEQTIKLLQAGLGGSFRRPQGPYHTYAPPLTREDERINWHHSARQVVNHIRGMNPFPGVYTIFKDKPLKILRAVLVEEIGGVAGVQPGMVTAVLREGFRVATGGGDVLITKVQPPGKKPMAAADFINGYRLIPGQFFE